jgi:hypothetical protein
MWFLHGNNHTFTRSPDKNVDFVETCFSGWIDFIVVRYSVANNDLPSNKRFRCQGNLVKVNRVWRKFGISLRRYFLPHMRKVRNYRAP